MSTLADLILEENEKQQVNLDKAFGTVEKNKQLESTGYKVAGELSMTYDALTSDGSKEDNFINTYNQEKLGYDPATGAPKESEMVPGLVVGAGVYKGAELATVGLVKAAAATSRKLAEQAALRGTASRQARKLAMQRTANLYSKKPDLLKSATKSAKKNKYNAQKKEYYVNKAGETFAKGAPVDQTIAPIAGEIAGNLAMPVTYAHQAKYNKETGDYTQYSDANVVANTVFDMGALAVPLIAGSRMLRSYKKAKTIEDATKHMDDSNWATTINLDKNAVESINKTYSNKGKNVDQNGFIVVNDLKETEGSHGAFIDANTGEFRVSSEYAGEAYGHIREIKGSNEGRLIVDEQKSDLNGNLFVDDYKGERAAGFIEADKVNVPGATKEYTSGKSFVVDEVGNIKANKDLQNRFKASEHWDPKKTDIENYDVLNAEIDNIRKGKSTILDDSFKNDISTSIGKEVPTNFKGMKFKSNVESKPTIEGQRILTGTGGSNNKIVNKVASIIANKDLRSTHNVEAKVRAHIAKNKEKYTFTGEDLRKNPYLEDLFDFEKIEDTDKHVATGIKSSVAKDMQVAIDLAIASAKNNKGRLTAHTVENGNLAKSAVTYYTKLHNIKPKEGTNAVDLNNFTSSLKELTQKMIDDNTLLSKGKGKMVENGTKTDYYEVTPGSRAEHLRDTYEALVDDNNFMTVDQVVSGFMRELDSGTKDVPVITKSGSNKIPKIKDDYSKSNGNVDKLAKHQASIEFHTTKTSRKNLYFYKKLLKDYLNGTNEDLLVILNDGKKPTSFNERKILEAEVDKLDRTLLEIEQNINQMSSIKDGVIKYPAEVGENLRVLYTADFSPMNNKIVRSIIIPKVNGIPLKGNEMFIKRSILQMIDASITKDFNGKPMKHKVNMMTDAEINKVFNDISKNGIEFDGKRYTVDKIVSDDMLRTKMAIDAEGFHSLQAYESLKQVIDGKQYIDILVEADGINNGYMFQELFAGNFHNSAVGLDVLATEGRATPDNIREFLLDMISNIKDKLPEGPAQAIAENIKPGDIKPAIFTKMYNGGLEVASDAMGSFMYDKYIKNILKETDPFVSQVNKLLDTFAGEARENIQGINELLERRQIIQDSIQEQRYRLSKASDKEIESVKNEIARLEAEELATRKDLDNLIAKTDLHERYFGISVVDLASAYDKLKLDAKLTSEYESTGIKPDRARVDETLLTPEEIEAVKSLLKRDARPLVEKTINRIYAKPEDLGFAKGTPEYTAQMNRYNLAEIVKRFDKETMMDFSYIINDKSIVPKSKYESTIKELSEYIAKDQEGLDVTQVARDLQKEFNKHGKSMSMNDVLNAVIHAGYKAKTVAKQWKLLDSHIPYIETMHGEKARLVTFESRMAMVETETGEYMNYENIVFRLNNAPIPVLATDSGVMGIGIGNLNANIMSILDAVWGGKDVQQALVDLNTAVADIGKNYNFYAALEQSRSRIKALKKTNISETSRKDAAHYLARTKNRSMKQDHMKLVDESERELNKYDKSTEREFTEKLDKSKQEVEKSQQNLPDDWEVQNYSLGSKDGVGRAVYKQDRFANKRTEVKSNVQERNYKAYEEVPVVKDLTTEHIAFGKRDSLQGKGSNNVDLKIVADRNEFDASSNTVTLSEARLTEKGWFMSNHEIGHKATMTLSESGSRALEQFLRDYMVKGKITGKKRNWNDSGLSEVDAVVYMLDDSGKKIKDSNGNYMIDFDETMSSISEILMANEGLLTQPDFFASKWGKPGETFNIAEIVEKQYLEINDNIFGTTKIHTMDQLIDHLQQIDKTNTVLIDSFKEWKDNHTVAYNSSTAMKAWVNGYELPKWSSTLKVGSERQRNYDSRFKENYREFASNAMKQNAHIGSLFFVNDKLEALNKIAALSQGFDTAHNNLVAGIKTELTKIYKENSGGRDPIEIDKAHGQHVSLGLHHLLDEVERATSYDDLVRLVEEYDVSIPNNDVVKNTVSDIIKTTGVELAKLSETENKKMWKAITREVLILAQAKDAHKSGRTSMSTAKTILETIDRRGENVGNKLADNKMLMQDLSKRVDKWIASTRIRNPKEFVDRKYLKESINEYYFKNASMSKFSKDQLGTWLLEEERARLEGNLRNQFNINPDLNYKKNGYTLSLKGKDKAGSISVYDPVAGTTKDIPLYFTRNEDLTIMHQNEVLISTKPSEFEKGRTKLKTNLKYDKKAGYSYIEVGGEKIHVESKNTGKMDLHVRPERMLNSSLKGERLASVDSSFSTMLTRNRSWTEGKKIKERLRLEQIQIGLDSGVIITAEKYMSSTTNKDLYHKMGDPLTESGSKIKVKNNNGDIQSKYGDLYYEKRFLADIEGTKGIRLDKKLNKLFGPGAGKVITEFTRAMIGMRDFAKQTILVYSPAGWINSALSSMSIYMTHASPGNMLRDRAMATKAIEEYRVATERYAKAVATARDSSTGTRAEKIAKAKEAMESTDLHEAMKLGISSTIRSDAFINNTYKTNPIVQQINEFTGNKYLGELIETVQADPTSRWGKKIGGYYDQLEIMPKLMLYFNKERLYKSKVKAAQYAMMANPQYARNLPGLFNAIDQVSPYTKYMISFPTMAIYAAKQNPGKLAAMISAYQATMYMSWHYNGRQLDSREQEMYSDGYMKIPGFDEAKFMQSAFAWNIPTKGFNDMSIADLGFPAEVPEHFINPLSAFNTTTDIHTDKQLQAIINKATSSQ